MSTTVQQSSLAYEKHGGGVPLVFLHGLTFNRTAWRPIIDRLGDDVLSIAIDLPGHGETGGAPCSLDEVAARVDGLLTGLGVQQPIVIGHSIAAGIAMIYAAQHSVRGVVIVDETPDVRPIGELIKRLEPALRGDDFAAAFSPFQQGMGIDRLPEPLRSQVLASQDIRQELVLGYWDEILRVGPAQVQARADDAMTRISAPLLCVLGRQLAPSEREHLLGHLPQAQLEEWPDRGHLVHLREADRFTARLRGFVDQCAVSLKPSGPPMRSAAAA